MVERLSSYSKAGLVVTLGGILLTGFVATSVLSYSISKENIRESVLQQELPLASDSIYSEIQQILLPPLNVSATMANSVFLRDWILNGEEDIEKITDYLNKIRTRQGMSSAFLVSDKTQNYYSYEGLRSRIDPAGEDDWYARCRDLAQDFEINADIDTHVSNRLTLFINYKVLDYEGRFIGVTGVATQIESIEALIRRFRKQYGKAIYFVSPSGQVAFRMDESGDPLEKPDLAEYMGSEKLASDLLSRPASTLEYERNGQNVLLNARFIPEIQWYLVVEEDVNSSLAYLRKVLAMNLSVCLLITLFVLTVVYLTVQQYQTRLLDENRQVSRMADELEERNRALERMAREKDEFMKVMVHDLKTPLSGMIGMARLVQEENDPAQTALFSRHIEEAGQEMAEHIQTLLDFKSLETEALPEIEALSVREVIRNTMPAWEIYARSKSTRILLVGADGDDVVSAGRAWLRTVLNNLVSNAVKYSPEGAEVKIDLCLQNGMVRVQVVDQGPGILPEERDKLFREFSRLSSRPTGGEGSTGLGLYIVKTMVEKMSGRVGVDSEPGEGSTFWFELPHAT